MKTYLQSMKTIFRLFLLFFFAAHLSAQVTPVPTNNILYVKKGATGNGSSWSNALGEVADALKFAKENATQWTSTSPLQIWVTAGTYKPLYDPADANFGKIPTDKKLASFLLVDNVQLYGGFVGTETNLGEQNWVTNKTILSGDLGAQGRVYQVVISSWSNAKTIMDGFTVTRGYASSSVQSRIIKSSVLVNYGGGLSSLMSAATFRNIIFSDNYAQYGGGIFNDGPNGIKFINVTVSGNSSAYEGGGIYNRNSFNIVLANAVISGNYTNEYGGGIVNQACSGSFYNITISGNKVNYSGNRGGGLYNKESSKPIIYNSIILGNSTGIYNFSTSDVPDIQYSLVQDLTDTTKGNINSTGVLASDIFITSITPAQSITGDFRLKDNVIVINKGDNFKYNTTSFGPKDHAGNTRIVGSKIDLGALENQNVSTLAVSDPAATAKVMVYPNPTTGIFFVKTTVSNKAVLYDESGRKVKAFDLKIGENKVDISTFTKGIYLLKTEQGVFKIIKK